ncbi:hypothetical protein DAEQUDRAFT_758517 [Daedalea quercina L-15889]|uniref:Uncharacterized protein n=1 Tax=Daedalea quercina L-15889 TaxID=1314783 RepID=A0A165NE26_9APHY|nr:hypothetical protein DAEQUDRAFT_758517 [Daedalea quercina L-15889]
MGLPSAGSRVLDLPSRCAALVSFAISTLVMIYIDLHLCPLMTSEQFLERASRSSGGIIFHSRVRSTAADREFPGHHFLHPSRSAVRSLLRHNSIAFNAGQSHLFSTSTHTPTPPRTKEIHFLYARAASDDEWLVRLHTTKAENWGTEVSNDDKGGTAGVINIVQTAVRQAMELRVRSQGARDDRQEPRKNGSRVGRNTERSGANEPGVTDLEDRPSGARHRGSDVLPPVTISNQQLRPHGNVSSPRGRSSCAMQYKYQADKWRTQSDGDIRASKLPTVYQAGLGRSKNLNDREQRGFGASTVQWLRTPDKPSPSEEHNQHRTYIDSSWAERTRNSRGGAVVGRECLGDGGREISIREAPEITSLPVVGACLFASALSVHRMNTHLHGQVPERAANTTWRNGVDALGASLTREQWRTCAGEIALWLARGAGRVPLEWQNTHSPTTCHGSSTPDPCLAQHPLTDMRSREGYTHMCVKEPPSMAEYADSAAKGKSAAGWP